MSTGRRIIIGDRGQQKEAGRASYIQETDKRSDTDFPHYSRSPSSNFLQVNNRFDERMKYSQFPRTPSQSNLRPREEYFKGTLAKRKNDGVVNNLKSELQNLKMEVSRLVNKDGDNRMTHSGIESGYKSMLQNTHSDQSREDRLSLEKYGKDVSDLVSVTSENLIDGPLKRLENQYQSEGYDHAHYLQLQNNLLKTELRNLKNKYNATKQQLKERCEAQQKKSQYLQISLRKSESQLQQCKRNLQVELQTIKFQLSRRYQQELEDQQKRYDKIQPERDSYSGNEHIQDKMKKLYEQLSNKNRQLSTLNIQVNEYRGQLEKYKFQLKKQQQKNSQIMKQLQLSKREKSRAQVTIEDEQNRKNEMQKTIDTLRLKIDELAHQLQKKDDIVSSSEQIQFKITSQLNFFKEEQRRLSEENCQLALQLRKIKQLNQSNEQEITYLKSSINEFTNKIEVLSRNLRTEKEKTIEVEEYYRKKLDQGKAKDEKYIEELKNECEELKYRLDQVPSGENMEQNGEIREMKEKNREAKLWKTQYKLLKAKYQELFAVETTKKQQLETYYKSYKQYKSKNKILEKRNKILEDSANEYIEKIEQIEAANLEEREFNLENIRNLEHQIQKLEQQNKNFIQELNELTEKFQSKCECLAEEEIYRRELEEKVMNLDLDENEGLNQILQAIKKRLEEQDERYNKFIKDSKNKQSLITKLRKQVKELIQNQEKEFESFRHKQIDDKIKQIQSMTFQSLKQYQELLKKQLEVESQAKSQILAECAELKGKQSQMDIQSTKLKQQIANITNLYNSKSGEMMEAIDNYEKRIMEMEEFIRNSQQEDDQIINNLKHEIQSKQEQIISLRSQVITLCNMKLQSENYTFDEALKNQIENGKKVREQLSKKNEEVYRLRDSLSNLKAELDTLKSTADIAKLRFISDKKNIQVGFEIQIQQLKNNIGVQQKKLQSLEQKIKMVIDENRKKDTFIQAYIMGKKLPTNERQFINAFLKEYEITVTGKNISERLQTESQELESIHKYNLSLMRDLAETKRRLAAFEGDLDEFEQQHSLSMMSSVNQ